jgi:hypothetical protein
MRKVYLEVKTKLIIEVEEGIEISQVMDGAEVTFFFDDSDVEVVDQSIEGYEITDSK